VADHSITLVLTSAGRYDLLARTLDSLYKHAISSFAEVIIAEDWEREGQVRNIDRAYARVKTNWILHWEEDFLAIRSGFLSQSFDLMNAHSEILQVQLRAYDDVNGHPVVCGPVYNYMDPHWSAGWCGFSWNPGLRRKSDWERIGGYMKHWQGTDNKTEQYLSQLYAKEGMVAAILPEAKGYVRHIGQGRSLQK